ncbi:MAG: tRNA-dihydrouridine synthase [bacterium]|nr:tRNA-dihydrouridine synthase [bacterium]
MSKPIFILAPMDDVTDTVFRSVIHSCAPADLYFTEFVNVDGLMSPGRPKLMKKLRFAANEGPLIAQLWGLKPQNFEAIARQIADGTIAREIGLPEGINYVGVDINMGCPAKSEVQNGACSALIKNRPLAKEIIEATIRGAGDMPVSVKTRLGFSEIDLSWHEFLLGFDLSILTIHWRTRKEMSKVPAHWEYASELAKLRDKISPNTKIIGNGDVLSREQGQSLIEQHGIDGVMIGRGIFHDPYIFAPDSPWETIDKEERIALYRRHVELFRDTWQEGERPIHTLNKFCKIYINGFDGAKELREVCMQSSSIEELLGYL